MSDCSCGSCDTCEARQAAERNGRILPFEEMVLLPGDRLFGPVRDALPDEDTHAYASRIVLEEHPGKGGRHRAHVSYRDNPHRYCGIELSLYEDDLKKVLAAIRRALT